MAPEISAASYKDRSTGLVLFGVLEILMGLVAGFMGFSILMVGLFMKMPNNVTSPWMASLFYVAIAITLIWLGVGSIMARRWARALLLVISWTWLVVGVVAGITLATTMPTIIENIAQIAGGADEANFVKWFTLIVMGVVVLVIYFLIPGALVLFYRSPHVKATCEAKDPKTRWTDLCPLPVLAMCLLYSFTLLMVALVMPAYGFIFPFFGTLLTGIPGALAIGMTVLLMAYICWGFYKLRPASWWMALGLTLIGYGSALMTFSKIGLEEMYQKMNFSPEQIDAVRKTGILDSNFMLIELSIGIVFTTGYLLFLKKYFKNT